MKVSRGSFDPQKNAIFLYEKIWIIIKLYFALHFVIG